MCVRKALAVSMLGALLTPAPAQSESNLLFILDSSGSMWGKLEGQAKMTTAKTSLSKLVGDLPKETKVGLMVYGHRYDRKEPNACSDIELLIPVGQATPGDIESWLKQINPKGKTPIANALQLSSDAFVGLEKSNNNIVLISDGIETCDGDPCSVAGKLAEANINVRVHVVGFDISEKDRAQLECIAKLGKGTYFSADSTEGFKEAVTAAVTLAQAPPTPPQEEPEQQPPSPPPAPQWKTIFEDNFDGEDLGEQWEFQNRNPDAYIVEDGELIALSATKASFADENVDNIFILNNPMPENDWRATIKLNIDFQTTKERIFFGMYHDKDNYLLNVISAVAGSCYPGGSHALHIYVSPTKATRGKLSSNKIDVWNIPYCGKFDFNAGLSKGQPILLRMEKKGRSYTSSFKAEGDQEAEWIMLPAVKLLRSEGKLALGLYQESAAEGETAISVDWLKVEVPDE